MPNFKTKQECAAFLLTKKNQGFISSPTWNKILERFGARFDKLVRVFDEDVKEETKEDQEAK